MTLEGIYKDVEYKVQFLDKIIVHMKLDNKYFVQSYYPEMVLSYRLTEYKIFGIVVWRKLTSKKVDDELVEELIDNSRKIFLEQIKMFNDSQWE